jgi:hypothetical protein
VRIVLGKFEIDPKVEANWETARGNLAKAKGKLLKATKAVDRVKAQKEVAAANAECLKWYNRLLG